MINNDGVLYFVQVENGGPIKVGYTQDHHIRLQTLQGWCPYKIEPIFGLLAPKIAETYALEVLKAHKLRGEWHYPHPFVLNFIEEVRKAGFVAGCPDPHPARGDWTKFDLVAVYDKCIPRIWPDRAAMALDVGQKKLESYCGAFSEILICRTVIAARKLGFQLKTADLVKVARRVDRPARKWKRAAQTANHGRPRKPKKDFILITAEHPTPESKRVG